MEIGRESSHALRGEFMTLLIAQLRNQDPLQPVEQQDFLSQLAQFSTLESMEGLGDRFGDLLKLQELSYGADLIGKSVAYEDVGGPMTGVVQAAYMEGDRLMLDLDGARIEAASVLAVSDPE